MENQKIIIAGGSGLLGDLLARFYHKKNNEVIVLSRSRNKKASYARYVYWDGRSHGEWQQELEGAYALVNLCGKSVNCRYNQKNKDEIIFSRVASTQLLGESINACIDPPEVWINASSAAIYGDSGDIEVNEHTQIAPGFSPDVVKAWENTFNTIRTPFTRKVCLRMSLVLSKGSGSVLTPFYNLAKFGLGGGMGSGNQFISWIHEDDFVRAINWVIDHVSIKGVYILSSSGAVTNKEFMQLLSTRVGCYLQIKQPIWMVKLGAWLLRTESELVLKGRRVFPEKLINSGFQFKYNDLDKALESLITSRTSV